MSGPRRPNLFVVGAPRCGTASMHIYLRSLPDVWMPVTKEPHYFARDLAASGFVRDLDDYLALFGRAGTERWIGEASPWYLYSAVAARLIRDFEPAARALVMLRDPIELMRSLHARNILTGNEDIDDFAEALAAEQERREGRRMPPGAALAEALFYRRVACLGTHVERLLAAFAGRDVHFVVLEDVAIEPLAPLARLHRFLEIEPPPAGVVFPELNVNRRARSRAIGRALYGGRWSARALGRRLLPPRQRLAWRSTAAWKAVVRAGAVVEKRQPLDDRLRARLQDELAGEVGLLSELVGIDLAARWWRQPSPVR